MKYIKEESVVLTLREFDTILAVVPMNKIIQIFAPDQVTAEKWAKLSFPPLKRVVFDYIRKHGPMQRDIII